MSRRTGGGEITDEAVSRGPIDLAEVAAAADYDLDAEYVVHAAMPTTIRIDPRIRSRST